MSNALQIALTGMNAVRVKTDNEGNNLANIQTPGYTNKVIETTSVMVDGLGAGVRVGPAKRLLEANLAKESRDQISVATHLDVTSTLLKQIEKEFGSIGDKNALPDLIKNFSNACDRLATSPTDSLARKDVIRAADTFSQEISRISHQIQKLRQDVDAKIATGVKDINLNLENIYSLNKTIIRNAGAGQSTADLEDIRDISLRTIAKHIDISTSVSDSGAMYIQTASGHALLFPAVIPISYTSTTVMNATSAYDPDPVVSTINAITVSDEAGNTYDITTGIKEGDIAAYLEMRDTRLPNLQQQLDKLSADFRDGVNKIHNLGTGVPPPTTLTGSTVFVDPTVDTFQGAGTVRLALVDKVTGQMVGGNTYDLDLTTLGSVSISALAGNLQGGLSPLSGGFTATCDASTNNKLVLDTGSANIGLAIVPLAGGATENITGRGFSHYFGLNDLILSTGHGVQGAVPDPGISQTLSVRADIVANDQYLSRGQLSQSLVPPLSPERLVTLGDGSVMTSLVIEMTTPKLFTVAGGIQNSTLNYIDYGATIITTHANLTKNMELRAASETNRQAALDYAIGEQSGVDMQRAFANLMELQQAYAANVHVITHMRTLFSELMQALK